MSSPAAKTLAGWRKRPLADLAVYHNGLAFKPSDWVEEGTKIIRIEQLNNPMGQYDHFRGAIPSNVSIKNGDLIFSWSATLKAVIWKHGPGVLNQHLFKVVPKPDVDKEFLLHLIDHNIEGLAGGSQGSTMRHIKRGELKKFEVAVPVSIQHQRRIADALSTVDNLIEKSEALVAKLQLELEGVTSELFLANSTWMDYELGDCLAIKPKNGFSPQEADVYTGTYVLGLGCLTPGGYLPVQLKDAPAAHPKGRAAVLKDGDLLVSRANTRELVGLPGIFRARRETVIYPDLMIRLAAGPMTTNEFLEIVLRSNKVRRQIVATAVGTSGSMVKTSSARLCSTKISLPPLDVQKKILAAVSVLKERILFEIVWLNKIRSMKLGLMADLLSGRVTMAEVAA